MMWTREGTGKTTFARENISYERFNDVQAAVDCGGAELITISLPCTTALPSVPLALPVRGLQRRPQAQPAD